MSVGIRPAFPAQQTLTVCAFLYRNLFERCSKFTGQAKGEDFLLHFGGFTNQKDLEEGRKTQVKELKTWVHNFPYL